MHAVPWAIRTFAAAAILVIATHGVARCDDARLPGSRTPSPKWWRDVRRHVTTFTPYTFEHRMEHLTPAADGALWFAVGRSLERVEPSGRFTEPFHAPDWQWRVGGIAVAGATTWVTLTESGKVARIREGEPPRYYQVVPRKDFPDLRDLVVDDAGAMWFADLGRRSIGYRSPAGSVIERPLPGSGYPRALRRCGAQLWVVFSEGRGEHIARVDATLHVDAHDIPAPFIWGTTCDTRGRLWLVAGSGAVSTLDRAGLSKLALNEVRYSGITADLAGAVWILGPSTLAHRSAGGRIREWHLPVDAGATASSSLARTRDGSLWFSVNYGNAPIALVRMAP